MPQYLCRTISGVVIARHRETIGARIVKAQYVALVDFGYAAVVCKSVCFANVAGYSIKTIFSMGAGNIGYFVLGAVEHWPNKMVETAVHLSKNRGGGLFYHIYFYQKFPCFTD